MGYCVLVPFAAPVAQRLAPELTVCRSLVLTGRPCAFCGLTRDAGILLATGRLPDPPHNPRAAVFLALFAIGAGFRFSVAVLLRPSSLKRWLLADAGLHGAMAAALAGAW